MAKDDHSDATVKPFAAVLQEVSKGHAHATLSEALRDLVNAVRDYGKAGALTVTVKVEPTKNIAGNITVSVTHTLKLPQEAHSGIFFVDKAGNPVRDDPDAPTLPVRGMAKIGETA